MSSLQARLNAWFDRLIRVDVRALGHRYSAFLVCGTVGLACAVVLGASLTWYQSLSVPVILLLAGTSVAALLGQSLVMKVLTGHETLVYYRHEIAIIVTAALTLWFIGQPLWPYLDITILAIGLFLVCGRIGCLMVGCCHGRPSRCGPAYTTSHATAGFTPHYVGVRLFPIQLVESLWVLFTVAVGVGMLLGGSVPGEVFAWYVIVYDIGRFTFEFLRGDPDRPYFAGFSEAQWTSVLLMAVVVAAEAVGVLPFHLWHWLATGALVAAVIVVARSRARSALARHRLLHPRHVREIAQALDAAAVSTTASQGTLVPVARTSLGVQFSRGAIDDAAGLVRHYTISSTDGEITLDTARTLADLVLVLQRVSAPAQLTRGSVGVFHLLIGRAGSAGS